MAKPPRGSEPPPFPFKMVPKRRLPTKRERRASSIRNAAVIAEICRKQYEAGDRFALMRAIYFCLRAGAVVPQWAASAYAEAFRRVEKKEIASWDAAFGAPWPKGMHLARARERDRLKHTVWERIHGQPGKEELFARVAEKLNIKEGTCRELYYEAEHEIRDLDPSDGGTSFEQSE